MIDSLKPKLWLRAPAALASDPVVAQDVAGAGK